MNETIKTLKRDRDKTKWIEHESLKKDKKKFFLQDESSTEAKSTTLNI